MTQRLSLPPGRHSLWAMLVFVAAITLGPPAPVLAHSFSFTDVLLVLKSDETYLIDVTTNLDALALGLPPTTDPEQTKAALEALSPEELKTIIENTKSMMLRRLRFRIDEHESEPQVSFPEYGTPLAIESDHPTMLGVTARFSGWYLPTAQGLRLSLSRAFGPVHLTIFEQRTGRSVWYVLGPGEDAPPYEPGRIDDSEKQIAPPIGRYLFLGYEHILPLGLDHILFVVGLFLLSPRLRPLLWQTAAFTVAHSVTLALSMLDVVQLSPGVVEPLIAASISYVAIENLLTDKLHMWRTIVVFCFGLLHGMGFAGALREVGLPDGAIVGPLLLFNLGVELGQLSVVLIALAVVGWFRRCSWYRKGVVIPASSAIALVGAYWCVQRAIG